MKARAVAILLLLASAVASCAQTDRQVQIIAPKGMIRVTHLHTVVDAHPRAKEWLPQNARVTSVVAETASSQAPVTIQIEWDYSAPGAVPQGWTWFAHWSFPPDWDYSNVLDKRFESQALERGEKYTFNLHAMVMVHDGSELFGAYIHVARIEVDLRPDNGN